MKKIVKNTEGALRREYDFSKGVRGVHASRYAEGANVVLLEPDPDRTGKSTTQDTQLTELAGRHLLIAQLTAGGIEVAVPVRDRGIDLIAYLDKGESGRDFIACPIQLKVSSKEGFTLNRKYQKIVNLLIAYVWNVGDPTHSSVYALTYQEALEILERKGHTKSASWKDHSTYHLSKIDEKLLDLLKPYKMTPEKWAQRISTALHATASVVRPA